MKKQTVLLAVCLCIALLAIVDEAEAGKKKKGRATVAERQERRQNKQERRQNQEQELTEAGWVLGECQPRRARSCGRGTKTATKDGEEDRTVKCVVPCGEGEARRGGQRPKPNRRRGGGCRYVKGTWGECENGRRSVTMTLSSKSDPTTCEASKTMSRPCTGKKGNAKCFYGPWTEFGECNNGVSTKTRRIIDGGERCQKRAVKNKPC